LGHVDLKSAGLGSHRADHFGCANLHLDRSVASAGNRLPDQLD
jgi:hypothetical protein